ncbi:MAG TPA: hypothetical protein PKK00_03740 [Bacteroidales bacterium]|nr:hypothetical protein [Bacteroidales bacterium]HPS16583.1 hypothetical protein [Bacteroidales bacterium]
MKKIIILINVILVFLVFIILNCCNNDNKVIDKNNIDIERNIIKKDTIIINWIKSYFYFNNKINYKSNLSGFYLEIIINNYTSKKLILNVRDNEDEILESNFYLLYYNEIKKVNDTIDIEFMDRGKIHEILPNVSDTLLLKSVMHSLSDEDLCLSTYKICKESKLMLKSNPLLEYKSLMEISKGDEFKIEIRFSRSLPKLVPPTDGAH